MKRTTTDKQVLEKQKSLCKAIAKLKTPDECQRFLIDLCTPAELQAMADRWQVAQLVDKSLPYRKIHDQTGVSTATITRVARCLLYGESGYKAALLRLKESR